MILNGDIRLMVYPRPVLLHVAFIDVLYLPPVAFHVGCAVAFLLKPVVHVLNSPVCHIVQTVDMYELLACQLAQCVELPERHRASLVGEPVA